MAEVERLLGASAVTIEPADAAGVGARACLDAYAKELTRRFANGFDPSRGPTVDRSEVTPPRGQFLLARLDGAAIGCIALKTIAPGVGEIKRMWVDPVTRGLSVARRLLAAIEAHAASLGLRKLRLDTNATQTEAIALYRNGGYKAIDAYNDNPYADLWFEKRIARAPTARATARRKSR
jgi:N-acetylglutamate synthase-like GNAT family acetyltransferase